MTSARYRQTFAFGGFISVRILIADDSPFWRGELRAILERDSSWIVFEASNGSEAVKKATSIHPDVVILDLWMPVLDGLGAARELKHSRPELLVVICTVDKSAFLEAAARQAATASA